MPLLLLLTAIVASRIVLHELGYANNAAAVTALALFVSCYWSPRQALASTLAVRFVSDLFIGFFSLPLMVAVYASHLAGVPLGAWIARKKTLARVIAAPLLTSAVFFLVTNFALLYSEYPHTLSGIGLAYLRGLPFLRGTLLGDVGYVVLFFGGYELARHVARTGTRALSSRP